MAGVVEMEYLCDGVIYKINETNAVHKLLDDGEVFRRYLAENSNNIEIAVQEHDGHENKENETEKQLSWNADTTKLLLSEYLKRKEEFRDPKIKKKSLWAKISQVFLEHNHKVTEDMLDKKFRNLKCHYKTIKDNNKKSKTGQGRITWDYFDMLDEIFREDKTINYSNVLSSMDANVSVSELSCSSSNKHDSEKRKLSNEETNTVQNTQKKPCRNSEAQKLYGLRKNMLNIENRRVEALEKIANELVEHNKIQKDRNNLIQQYFNK